MARTVTLGTYHRDNEAQTYAVPNQSTTFPTLPPVGPAPPRGTQAVGTLARVPLRPYAVGENVTLDHGNNNEVVLFTVTSVIGPAKYGLTVR